MSSFDNEIYRGPPEAGPTLEHDIRSYGSDVYILKAEKNTLAQDVPPTEEPIRQETKPVQKKESKIAKAMKLLASCTAAATIAATLAATPLPPAEKPAQTFDEWPGFSQLGSTGNGFAFSTPSQHSNIAQASVGAKAYRITAKQKDLHLFWQTTYNTDYDDNREGFCLMMDNWAEDWYVVLDVHTHPQEPWDDSQLLDQITTTSGEALYLRAEFIGGQEQSMDKLQNILDHLSDYIEISEATEDGWGKALIGYTMYSDTNAQWNGIVNTPDVNPGFDFGNIHYRQHANYSEENFIRSLTINDIDWSFYYSFDEYSLWLWAVPSQEDIALGAALDFLVDDMGLSVSDLAKGSPEINTELMDRLGVAVELAAKQCFSNYHLYTGFYDPPVYFPEISPMDPVGPGTGLPPDIQPDNPFTEEYFIGYPFSFEGRNFQMDSLRDDILFRQIYQTHDHAQFDFRVDNEGLRVQLIISAAPNGKDYYPYYLADGTEIFVAAFNYWGEPWIADEVTLSNLAEYLSSYVQITETTELFIPETEPDPYDYLPEYTQYIVDSSGMSYSPYARSNRVCHFSTNGGNYRLESQSPDLFMLWENYYYDMKEESANSYITFNNIADGWSMGVWIFDEPVDSVYDSFTLTAGDGTTLWFYIANFDDYSQQNNLEAILMKLPDILFLSRAKDGDWTKVLYGENLIVDITSSWSGLAYTANNDDFWCFDQMISVNDLQNHNLRFADSRTVNGATWEFYTTGGSNGYGMTAGKEFYSTQVFAVPTGGDICFATSLYNGLSVDQYEFSSQAEYEAYIDANIHPAIDTIVSQGLSNFHSYQSPDNVPNDPSDPADPSLTGDYFTGLDFSLNGRSFRMDALRNDVSFRQVEQFDNYVGFDFRVDDENLRVPLLISSTPFDWEYYPYYLTNGSKLFVSAFSNLGEPWTSDEQTLAALVQNLSAYVYIDETTDPYSNLTEFIEYTVSPTAGTSYTSYSRSNRVCQFVTGQSTYRLESQIPDVFIVWERYTYNSQYKATFSSIRMYHAAERWRLNLMVCDQPTSFLEERYDSFSLTAEDGVALWFYFQPSEDVPISRILELVKLTVPQEDGWGKIRIGETVIVNQTPYWSGFEYTVGGDSYWQFHSIMHSSSIAEYDLRVAGSRVVNGIRWNFYTLSGFFAHGSDGAKIYETYSTILYAVAQEEDICLEIYLERYHDHDGGLSLPEYMFSSRADYDACLDANIGSIIDTIVSQGLSNFYPYSE